MQNTQNGCLRLFIVIGLVFCIAILILVANFALGSCQVRYKISGTVYEWVDAPVQAQSWVYVDPKEDVRAGKNLVPLEGVTISFRALKPFDFGGRPPKELFHLESTIDGAFNTVNVSTRHADGTPTIVDVSKDGYQDMGLETFALGHNSLIVIMVKK
jgi:hypothetical protein